MKCGACGFDSPEGMRFCGGCGEALERVCGSCGSEVPAGFRFCGQCGAAVEGAPPAAAPSPAGPARATSGGRVVPFAAPDEEARPAPVEPEAERRQLTVMFCDLVGSTEASSALDPEEWRDVMRRYQSACSEVVERYEGTIAQYLGDGILVYLGFPVAHDDDAQRAAHAALGILSAMEQLHERMMREHGVPVAVRIGIHTGLVVAGEVGAGARREQLALGQVPNVAARLQGLAEPSSIVLSADTYAIVRDHFACESLGPHELKGVPGEVEVYRLLHEEQSRSSVDAVHRRGLVPLVGRQEELALMVRLFHSAREGRGRALVVQAEPGLGKSRLLHDLQSRLGAEAHTVVLSCSSYHRSSAYHALLALFEDRCRVASDDGPEVRLERLESYLESLGEPLDESVPLLADLLSVPLGASYKAPDWSPPVRRQKLMDTVLRLFLAEAGDRPLLLVVEDLHWVDPSTLSLVHYLIDQVASLPVLAVFTCRTDFRPTWEPRSYVSQISLDRLDRKAAEAIVLAASVVEPLPPEVVSEIVERSDGVPLFLEELTKAVVAEHRSAASEGSTSSGEIPSTLRDSLMARLDRMADAKAVAQVASVMGREFPYGMLAKLVTRDREELLDSLDQLVRAELLVQQGTPPDSRYSFKHALIRDAAYDSLLRASRQRHHRRIGDLLLSDFERLAEASPEVVANHYTEGQEYEKAVQQWLLAGQRSLRRSAIAEATQHLESGLRLLEKLPAGPDRDRQELSFQSALGASWSNARGFAAPEVDRAYHRALEICDGIGDTPELFWVLWGLRRFHLVRANLGRARELSQQLVRIADEVGEPAVVISAHFAAGATLFCHGELEAARRHLETAVAADDPERTEIYALGVSEDSGVAALAWQAWTLWFLGDLLWFLGDLEGSRRHSRRAVELARALDHPLSLIYALLFASYLGFFRRDPDEVVELSRELVELCRQQVSWWEGTASLFLEWARIVRATEPEAAATMSSTEVAASIDVMRRGHEGYVATGGRILLSLPLASQAEVLGRAGRLDEARALVDEALAEIDATGERFFEPEVLRLRGRLDLLAAEEGGDGESFRSQARERFAAAVSLARQQLSPALALRAVTDAADLAAREGREAEAREWLDAALAPFAASAESPDLGPARRLRERLA
jgi:class 3 adenylate cyclase/tetratricopeptide (TPR) repeat protein